MMSEAELYLMKGRLLEGMRNKARRGELLNHPPMGDVRGPDGDYQLDPDERSCTCSLRCAVKHNGEM